MRQTSLAATLFGAGDLRLVEREMKPLQPGMVRVAFGAGGICGSDMHYFRHARSGDFAMTTPLVLGHEIAGQVIEVNSTSGGLAPGTRVAVNPSRWCGTCPPCRNNRPNLCEDIHFMGSASKTPHMQGGFASLFDVVPAQCVPIPAHVSYAAAALAEPLAVALHAVARAGDVAGQDVLVVGAGPIGLLTMLAARHAEAGRVTVTDIAPAALAFAESLGAETQSAGKAEAGALFGIVFEASGAASGLASAIAATARGGTLVQIGNLPAGDIPVAVNAIMAKEIDMRGSFRFGHEFATAVGLIASGAIDTAAIISAQRPLAETTEAMHLALDRSVSMKVMLTGALG